MYVKETYDKTGEGQAKDIARSLKCADIQGETVDVAGALVATSSTDGVLKSMHEVNDEIEAAIIVARNLGTQPLTEFSRLHRLRRPSRRLDDSPSTATPVLYDITIFYR